MKYSLEITVALIAVILCGLISWALLPDHSMTWNSFEDGMRELELGPGLHIQEMRSLGAEEVPLPWIIAWNPRRWGASSPRALTGFPNSGARYLITANDSTYIQCDVRYRDNRAVFVVISGCSGQEDRVAKVCDAIAKKFPGLPSRVVIE